MNTTQLLARAVESAVFQCLMLAYDIERNPSDDPEEDAKKISNWFKQADKLEKKFITEHGRH